MALSAQAEAYRDTGLVTFSRFDSPFSADEWRELENLIPPGPAGYEYVETGDTLESTAAGVFRLLRDGNPPQIDPAAFASVVMRIIGSREKLGFYGRIIGKERLMIRRAQIHMMLPGGHLGYHKDSDSSTEYLAAVVLQFEAATQGGDFVIYRERDEEIPVRNFSVLMTHADLPHAVRRVEEGRRVTLAFWLAAGQ